MEVFGILLIIFVSNANSQLFGFNLQKTISSALCTAGEFTASVTVQTQSGCSSLSEMNNPMAKTANFACGATTGTIGGVSKMLKKNCPNGQSQDPDSSSQDQPSQKTTKTTNAQTPQASESTTTSTTNPPTTTTQAPTTQTIQAPKTTPTTQTPTSTTPMPCTNKRIQECTERCQRDAEVDLNLGGVCKRYLNNRQYRCDCIPVKHCDSYENATCTMECKNTEICRIPEANFPCVCKTRNGDYNTYRLPSSPYA